MDLAIQEIQEFMESQIDLPDMTDSWAQHAGSLSGQMDILARVIETFGLGLQTSLKYQGKTMEDQLDDILDLQEVRPSLSLI